MTTAESTILLMQWQINNGKDPIGDFPAKTTEDAREVLVAIQRFWGASRIRYANRKRGGGVYRAVVRFGRTVEIVSRKLDKEDL